MTFLVLLAVCGVVAYRATAAEDRQRYFSLAITRFHQARAIATQPRPDDDALRTALRTRTPFIVVVPAIIVVNIAVYAAMVAFGVLPADPATLVRWGASVGPRTTNGEWWRLLTSLFLHTSKVQLVVEAAVLVHAGFLLERLLGRRAVACVYIAAGVIGGVLHLSARPVATVFGAAGGTFGLYGLLIACVSWQFIAARQHPLQSDSSESEDDHRRLTIPQPMMMRLGVAGVVFTAVSAYNGATAGAGVGLLVGVTAGMVLGWRATLRTPTTRVVATIAAAGAAVAVGYAIPLRHLADVKPELARVIEVESRTAAAYAAALERYKRGRMSADALAQVAESAIVPELQDVDARLAALVHVPPEHQPLVADAREFLRLRRSSWRARAVAIRQTNAMVRDRPGEVADASWRLQAEARFRSNATAAGSAEGAERASLVAFERVKRASAAPES